MENFSKDDLISRVQNQHMDTEQLKEFRASSRSLKSPSLLEVDLLLLNHLILIHVVTVKILQHRTLMFPLLLTVHCLVMLSREILRVHLLLTLRRTSKARTHLMTRLILLKRDFRK